MIIKPETLAFLGGKKYAIVWVAFIVATFAMFFKIAAFLEWSGFVLGEFGFYFVADTKQKKNELIETTKIEVAKMEVTGESTK